MYKKNNFSSTLCLSAMLTLAGCDWCDCCKVQEKKSIAIKKITEPEKEEINTVPKEKEPTNPKKMIVDNEEAPEVYVHPTIIEKPHVAVKQQDIIHTPTVQTPQEEKLSIKPADIIASMPEEPALAHQQAHPLAIEHPTIESTTNEIVNENKPIIHVPVLHEPAAPTPVVDKQTVPAPIVSQPILNKKATAESGAKLNDLISSLN